MIEQRQHRMAEWLPYPEQPLDLETAELFVSYYADQIGELCAGIQLTLQQRHEDVRVYFCTVKDLRQNWAPEGLQFNLAHVSVVNWSHAKVVRFVQLRCDKVTGHIVLIDLDRLPK